MSKAILVMDMPSSCVQCRLHSLVGKDCDVICGVQGKTQSYEEASEGKPDWCPLKPMPEKKDENKAVYNSGYYVAVGYNACVDELLMN